MITHRFTFQVGTRRRPTENTTHRMGLIILAFMGKGASHVSSFFPSRLGARTELDRISSARSALFVPGDRHDRFDKAAGAGADALDERGPGGLGHSPGPVRSGRGQAQVGGQAAPAPSSTYSLAR